MNCGKPPDDSCKENDDCSSKYCSEDNYCVNRNNGPSDSDSTQPLIKLIATIAIITLINYCYHKYNNYLCFMLLYKKT